MDRPSDAEILAIAARIAELQGQPGGAQLIGGFSEERIDDRPEDEKPKPLFDPNELAGLRQLRNRVEALEGKPELLADAEIRLGVPTAVYTAGATITLNPCDAAGQDNGADDVVVQAAWTLPANTNIPVTAIIPFTTAADGLFYILGQGREVITNMQYDTTAHKLQKKVRYDFGWFATTESSVWVDITEAVDCTAA